MGEAGSKAGPDTDFTTPLKRKRTSAVAVGLRASLPLKITSSILSPRRLFALCSPITQVMASATLLLPHPFGPTIAVTPLSKASSKRSENDLEPVVSRRSRRMTQRSPERLALQGKSPRCRPRVGAQGFQPSESIDGWLGCDLAIDRSPALFRSREDRERPRDRNGGQCNTTRYRGKRLQQPYL